MDSSITNHIRKADWQRVAECLVSFPIYWASERQTLSDEVSKAPAADLWDKFVVPVESYLHPA
jgi:hypothetical protein